MKKTLTLIMSTLMVLFLSSCSCENSCDKKGKPEVNAESTVKPSDGLDFKLVGALFQDGKVKDAESLEKELNKSGGINNLDLNSDGKVDYINVSENKGTETVKSFDLTTGKSDDLTHIGTVEVEKGKEGTYKLHMSGSEDIYGAGHSYNSSISTGELLLFYWMFSATRPMYYHQPYYMGYYPSGYNQPVVVNKTVYVQNTSAQRTATSSISKSTTPYSSKVASANKGKTSVATRTSINNHKTAQKQLAARKASEVKTGGFTKSSTSSSSSTKSTSSSSSSGWGSSSRSSSSRSWGGGSSSRSFSSGGRRSDIKSKENIQLSNYGLDELLALSTITYNYKEEFVTKEHLPSTKQVGLIAQEVEKVVPEVVSTDTTGYKVVSYDLLVPVLIQAIQEQQKQIEALKLQTNKN